MRWRDRQPEIHPEGVKSSKDSHAEGEVFAPEGRTENSQG
jgi:hypothetical protein